MAKKCIKCGRENDDSSLRCVCEGGVPAEAAIAPAATRTTEPIAQLPSPPDERNLVLRKIGFVVWAIAFVPLFAALRSYLHVPPFYRSLIGTGVFCAPAVAALWFLGGEKHPTLRVWRVGFVLWMIFLVPVLLTKPEYARYGARREDRRRRAPALVAPPRGCAGCRHVRFEGGELPLDSNRDSAHRRWDHDAAVGQGPHGRVTRDSVAFLSRAASIS